MKGMQMGLADWWQLVQAYLRPYRRRVVVLAVALFTSIALQLATPQLVRLFIDRAASPQAARSLGILAGLYMAAVVVQQAFRIAAAWPGELLGWLTANDLRAGLMAHCLP